VNEITRNINLSQNYKSVDVKSLNIQIQNIAFPEFKGYLQGMAEKVGTNYMMLLEN